MSTFVQYATEVLSPPRLRGAWGTKWVTAFAAEYDWLKKRLTQSVLVRYPRFAPDDGLVLLGWERQIEKAPGETSESYATRIGAAWETWEWSGTGPGVLAGLASCGVPSPAWGRSTEWPTGWLEDGLAWLLPLRAMGQVPSGTRDQFARFWVVIDYYAMTGGRVTAPLRGEQGFYRGKWGARGMLEESMPQGQWRAIKRSIRKWRGQGETCPYVVFCSSENGVADLRAPLWRRGTGTIRGSSARLPGAIRGFVGEEGYKVQ
jgi:hypothetical protein